MDPQRVRKAYQLGQDEKQTIKVEKSGAEERKSDKLQLPAKTVDNSICLRKASEIIGVVF